MQAELAPRQSKAVWRDSTPKQPDPPRSETLAPSALALQSGRSAATKLAAAREIRIASEAGTLGGEESGQDGAILIKGATPMAEDGVAMANGEDKQAASRAVEDLSAVVYGSVAPTAGQPTAEDFNTRPQVKLDTCEISGHPISFVFKFLPLTSAMIDRISS